MRFSQAEPDPCWIMEEEGQDRSSCSCCRISAGRHIMKFRYNAHYNYQNMADELIESAAERLGYVFKKEQCLVLLVVKMYLVYYGLGMVNHCAIHVYQRFLTD